MFVRNSWYIGCEASELEKGGIVARKILNQNVALYRGTNGKVAALKDECPHRFAPLSLGQVRGGSLQCGYHGAVFGADGKLQAVPGQKDCSATNGNVEAYPALEKYGYVWLWMGDKDLAEESKIPEIFELSVAPGWLSAFGNFQSFQANYQLLNDNLFDVSHAGVVHPETFANPKISEQYRKIKETPLPIDDSIDGMTYQEGSGHVSMQMRMNDLQAGPIFHKAVGAKVNADHSIFEGNIDWYLDIEWWAPCYFLFRTTSKPTGAPIKDAVSFFTLHSGIPETETSTHYYFKCCQNLNPSDHELAELHATGARFAFEQDKRILTRQQEVLGEAGIPGRDPVKFMGDHVVQIARSFVKQTIENEASISKKYLVDA